jgi:hypothetical protein
LYSLFQAQWDRCRSRYDCFISRPTSIPLSLK